MASNYTKIYSGNFLEVQRIVTRLHDIDIEAVVKDESESARLGSFGPAVPGLQDVYVSNEEVSSAKVIVDDILSNINVEE